MVVEYDGTNYNGWQRQRQGTSIQATIEDAFLKMLGKPIAVRGAGRTDAGVHAEGQVAAFDLDDELDNIPPSGFRRGLNSHLPDDIAVVSVEVAPHEFSPRWSARGKIYRYRIWNHEVRSPLHARDAWHVIVPLDTHRMRTAAALFVGEHDFRGFRASDCERRTTRRVLHRVDVKRSGSLIEIEIEGTAFLKNMVRIIAGTMVDVTRGRLTFDGVADVLQNGDRRRAGVTAPSHGLTMVRVLF
ncbi:MAG: tRNA pseudouridine(38-40) synthase TruA [Deltaproteobacteria bacterium]|nr:tRNA pseudouridine(38-40) synthase TruA [Deltaproteobacteria bacterium]